MLVKIEILEDFVWIGLYICLLSKSYREPKRNKLMDFIDYICTTSGCPKENLWELEKDMKTQSFAKKEIVLELNSLSKKIYFVEEGIIRVLYHSDDKDVTLYFGMENEVSVPIESIFYNRPCKFGIQAVTNVKIVMVDYTVWEKMMIDNPKLQAFQQSILIKNLQRFTDYIYNTNFKTPKERFDDLMQTNPSLFNKVPLGYIASYLGIMQETLSRLRKG